MIEPELLRTCELKVHEMAYDLMDLLVTVYDEIEEFEHLIHATIHLYSISQLMNYGLIFIKNTNNFETGIYTLIMRPVSEHT